MKENAYQTEVIKKLRLLFVGCVILKNDSTYMQGVPDLLILFENKWAMLEVKASKDSPIQPNQEFYVNQFSDMSFAAFIYPENEEVVFNALQRTFQTSRPTRVSKRKQTSLG
jgi:hypothetical protein